MNNDMKGGAAVGAARRRLVRGVFAAPAALTLCSGSVYAQASSQTCLTKAVNDPVNAPTPADSSWVRVNVRKVDSDLSTWVSGDDLRFLKVSDTQDPYLSTAEWQCLNPGNNSKYKKGDVISSKPSGGTPSPTNDFIAVRFDGTGRIIGVQELHTNGSTAMAMTCWNSINVRA